MKYIVLLSLLLLSACGSPERVEQTSNNNYAYEILFTRNDCEFGRYRVDLGRYVHTVICDNKTNAQTSIHQACGKNCTRENIVITN